MRCEAGWSRMKQCEEFHARLWHETGVDYESKSRVIGPLALALLFCTTAYPQRQTQGSAAQSSGTEASARVALHSSDIISDNLDRVAASADQILEVVNKEAGLMVELKRLLAQDAGASGQILEESDLTDVAVSERLQSDLHARVLATRLLQRYGYLVPRLNPDSDLESEQKLVRQERAQMLARAAQRRDDLDETATTGRGCDPSSVGGCVPPSAFGEDRENFPQGPITPARPPRSRPPLQRGEEVATNQTRPNGATVLDDQRSAYPAYISPAEIILTPARLETNPRLNGASPTPMDGIGANLSAPQPIETDLQSLSISQPNQLSRDNAFPRSDQGFERYPGGRNSATPAAAGEPVTMVHRPNPYADVPSLYDLYVQAGATNRPIERFGLDVFRKEAANPDYIPMDLPVGPSYV